jgi:L-fucose isomerase-like protein
MDHKIVLGIAPTRRGGVFVNPDALKQKALIYDVLKKLNFPQVELVDLEGINEEGLLRSKEDVPQVIERFRAKGVNALFFPHCNFGSEHSVAKVAAAFHVPVLLWGPRDEAPEAYGSRLRDTQCGLFATGKVLRRMNVPFTYLPNCRTTDPLFAKGLEVFLGAANVVKEFRKAKILQISVRPDDFWTMMCNEGELLEKFGIQIFPVSISDLVDRIERLLEENPASVQETVAYIYQKAKVEIEDAAVRKLACLKVAMKEFALENDCGAVAIQCWYSLQKTLGIMPCLANALLTEEGIPVACETDIHGAISSLILQAAGRGVSPSFFVDLSVRHPEVENGELLQHCGPWPLSLAKETPVVTKPFAFSDNCPGSVVAECKGGEITLLRFDGDHGEYGMLLGTAKGIEGPHNHGTYLWVEVPNWPKVETMIVKGPYVHHATGIHGNLLPVLYTAAEYLPGIRLDFYDEEQKKETENVFFQ